MDSCQFAVSGSGKGKERRLLGGIGKAGDAHPDPYHTYLALASLAIYSPVSGAHAHAQALLTTLSAGCRHTIPSILNTMHKIRCFSRLGSSMLVVGWQPA